MSRRPGWWLVVVLFVSTLAGGRPAQGQSPSMPPMRTFEPRDDAANDAGFTRFRQDVRRAAEVCTEASLRRILAPTAPGNHVTMPPSRAFWHYWKVEDGSGLPGLCRILDRAMALGAVREEDGVYCAPYVSCHGAMPRELPMGEYLIGVVERVEIRSRPSAMATVLAQARYPVLVNCRSGHEPCGRWGGVLPDGWRHVRLDATVGYVTDAQLDDQIEPSLTIRRLRVGWRVTAFAFYD
jgi:hypothetical protein